MKSIPLAPSKKAFTLIELLVVIAIIAILAAILFPVFAQAKLAAKKTASLSNTKQTTLGTLIYVGDTDDVMPLTAVYEWSGATPEKGWPTRIAPYLKNVPILRNPIDSGTDGPSSNAALLGPWISYASNSLTNWSTDNGVNNNSPIGVITPYFPWEKYNPLSATSFGRPAETIIFAERHNQDALKAFPTWGDSPIRADFQPWMAFVYDDARSSAPWSPGISGLIPRGTRTVAPSGYPGNIYAENDPKDKAGTMSAHFSGTGTVSFVDGHAKAMKPEATNPDPINTPEKNMWDGRRS